MRPKNTPTLLPLCPGEEVLAMRIKLNGVIAAPDIPARTLAVKRTYICGAMPAIRLAREKKATQGNRIFLKSTFLDRGPYSKAAKPYGSI